MQFNLILRGSKQYYEKTRHLPGLPTQYLFSLHRSERRENYLRIKKLNE